MAEGKKGVKNISLAYLIEQALKIPKVKVNREAFLRDCFANQGILIHQILAEGPVASDFSDIELEDIASKLILRRTSESSAMSFAAGIPGGLAVAATIPADTLQFFAMSLRMTQELAYLFGARDFFACEGEEGVFVRYLLICSLGAMYGIDGAAAATRLLSAHLSLRATGGIPQHATTREFWDIVVKRISRELTIRLTTDTASKGIAKLIPVIGGFFSGGMTFFAMRPMGEKLCSVYSDAAFQYNDSRAMKDYITLEDLAEKDEMQQMESGASGNSRQTADNADSAAAADTGAGDWGALNPEPASEDGAGAEIPINFGGGADGNISVNVGGQGGKPAEKPQDSGDATAKTTASSDAKAETVDTNNAAGEAKTAPAPMTMDEVFATIERLAALRDKGAITQEDFDTKKAELLARI